MKKIDRRNFFTKLSLGAIGTFIISSSPISFIVQRRNKQKVKVQLHPSSVKRNK